MDASRLLRKSGPSAALFCAALVVYGVTNYGGVRSPDSEIVFRAAESLADAGSFEVKRPLESLAGHRGGRGTDGRLYSLYGPVESVVLAPLILAAKAVDRSGWYAKPGVRLPVSHYNGLGMVEFVRNVRPSDLRPHALRYLVSFVNPVIGALIVIAFYALARLLARPAAAGAVTLLYGFGTLLWPYAGTFFSEQLATLFLLVAVHALVRCDGRLRPEAPRPAPPGLLAAGACLGLAGATHLMGFLFVPFLGVYAIYLAWRGSDRATRAVTLTAWFAAGFVLVMALWGAQNAARFGSFLETGRTLDAEQFRVYGVGSLGAPWRGLYGLLVSGGKGLLVLCPAVVLGLAGWPRLHRRQPVLSWILAAAIVFRLLFVAGLRDIWHGGFALGPRYLLMLVPFLLLPAALWLEGALAQGRALVFGAFALATIACAIEQWYLCLGEVFSFYHVLKWKYQAQGVDLFANDRLYVAWEFSPLGHLHRGMRGPFFLQGIPIGNLALWGVGSLLLAAMLAAAFWLLWRQAAELG